MNDATPTTAPKLGVPCWCGCGGLTKKRFVPGHDARFHGRVKKVLRGELNGEEELAKLPHDDARTAFLEYHDKIEPAEAEKAAKAAEKAAAKEKAKAEREAAKAEAETEALQAA